MNTYIKPTYEIITRHSGHTFYNGMHWCDRCEICGPLIIKANAIAAEEESTNGQA